MEKGSNNFVLLAVVVAAVLAAIILAALVVGGPRSDFDRPADMASIEQALASNGLHICAQGAVNWTATPGFVFGKYYDIETNCTNYDPNKPGARVWVVRFSSLEARDAALRNFETNRRHIGTGIAWSNGPFVIFVDGSQKSEVISIVRDVLPNSGAQKGRG